MGRLLKKLDNVISEYDKNKSEFDFEKHILSLHQTYLSVLENLCTIAELDLDPGHGIVSVNVKRNDKVMFDEFNYVVKKVRELLEELDLKILPKIIISLALETHKQIRITEKGRPHRPQFAISGPQFH